ncbi:MAG: hypothetical protein D6718_01020 [Acidobacteria bacterium]|nr:MAG: hypothetical protein D6718_01020 [Acidobacteriota bacterium]
MRHRSSCLAAAAFVLLAAAPAALARGGWTNPPYDCSRCHVGPSEMLAELKFELKHPAVASQEDFAAVRSLQRAFADRYGDAAFVHPPAGIACSACHAKGPLAFHRFSIDESDVAASCARCHGLEKLQKVKYEVKARTGFDRSDPDAMERASGRIAALPDFDRTADYPPAEEIKLGAEVRSQIGPCTLPPEASLMPAQALAYERIAKAHLVPGADHTEGAVKFEGKSKSDSFDWSACDAFFADLDRKVLDVLPWVRVDTRMEPRKRRKEYKLPDCPAEDVLTLAQTVEPEVLTDLPDEEFKNEYKVRSQADPRLVDEGARFFTWKGSQYRDSLLKAKFEVKWKPLRPVEFEHKVELAAASP